MWFIIAWITCGIIAAGFLNRHSQESFYAWDSDGIELRETLAKSIGMGLLFGPVALIISPFMTGFFIHGWSLSPLLKDGRNLTDR